MTPETMTPEQVADVLHEANIRLRREIDIAKGIIDNMQERLTATQMHEQKIAEKFRGKVAALESELKLAQRGLSSGCGCPIGECVRKTGDTGSCWVQWAEFFVVRRTASQQMDEMVRHAHHPGRFREVARVDSPPSIAPPAPGEDDERAR